MKIDELHPNPAAEKPSNNLKNPCYSNVNILYFHQCIYRSILNCFQEQLIIIWKYYLFIFHKLNSIIYIYLNRLNGETFILIKKYGFEYAAYRIVVILYAKLYVMVLETSCDVTILWISNLLIYRVYWNYVLYRLFGERDKDFLGLYFNILKY